MVLRNVTDDATSYSSMEISCLKGLVGRPLSLPIDCVWFGERRRLLLRHAPWECGG